MDSNEEEYEIKLNWINWIMILTKQLLLTKVIDVILFFFASDTSNNIKSKWEPPSNVTEERAIEI